MVPLPFTFLFWVCVYDLAVKMSLPTQSRAEMLSRIPKHWKAVIHLTEEKQVLDKLHPSMSQCSIGHDFSVYGSAIYIT